MKFINKKQHFFEMEFLRGFAILLVLSIHISVAFTSMDTITFLTYLYMSIDSFSQVAVPLFIFISGFVLFFKYQNKILIFKFYKKRFLSIIPPYLFFSTFYILLSFFLVIYLNNPVKFSLKNNILFTYLTGGASVHLWFFVLIIQLYILYPILEYLSQFVFKSEKLTILFFLFLFLIHFLYQYILCLHSLDNNTIFYDFWKRGLIFSSFLLYFVFGMYVSLRYNDFKEFIKKIDLKMFLIPLLIYNILGIIFFINTEKIQVSENLSLIRMGSPVFLFFQPIFNLLIFLILFVIVLNIKHSGLLSQWLKKIGNFSFGIFLIHVFFLMLLRPIFTKMNFVPNNYLYFPVLLLLTLVLSMVSLLLIRKIPFSHYIIGKI